ncbi:hypothetical protein FKR81_23360 [Lentzea tibetensis]|uniref:Uncharacterized protein n=1 Tax=Lentzea tibetensis TaxID=2591470 RepID=A0A563EQB7_9PSEU|nr:hypothetical protein [Lentzea tibetensis]TWP49489.1 hypothetical protein FKR81_23360 [Lentzea tibetensis]
MSRRRAVSAFHCTDTASASTVLALLIDTATGAGNRLSCRTTCTNEGNATANDTICTQLAAVSNEPYPRNATLISRCEAILVGSTWLSTQNGAAQQLRRGHRDVLAFTGRPELDRWKARRRSWSIKSTSSVCRFTMTTSALKSAPHN